MILTIITLAVAIIGTLLLYHAKNAIIGILADAVLILTRG